MHTVDWFADITIGNTGIRSDTGANLLQITALYLCNYFRVTDMGPGHTYHIRLLVGNNSFRVGWIGNSTNCKHWQIDDRSNRLCQMDKLPMFGGRRCPVLCPACMRNIGMSDHVQVVDQACLRDQLRDDFHIIDCQSTRLQFITGYSQAKNPIWPNR